MAFPMRGLGNQNTNNRNNIEPPQLFCIAAESEPIRCTTIVPN
eukprot:CAMPEP_0204131802 /NCGR_PEP_ID=MMETSP0361-20130328/14155_1 /ASSEMBLY_ACC=CAM_ASM_000343 /TAXON_ID=268821 /ORGANISM="Scrippsiella Hangoei, Strain SHTV-5" /LENGTH=42 /DNA_ID= /DNA_START= /DNA_END= /DNA_ORIENTATION=